MTAANKSMKCTTGILRCWIDIQRRCSASIHIISLTLVTGSFSSLFYMNYVCAEWWNEKLYMCSDRTSCWVCYWQAQTHTHRESYGIIQHFSQTLTHQSEKTRKQPQKHTHTTTHRVQSGAMLETIPQWLVRPHKACVTCCSSARDKSSHPPS